MWLRYLHYLESNMRAVAVVILPVIARAVRNCPWQASLWTSYIRAMERYKKPQAEIDEVRLHTGDAIHRHSTPATSGGSTAE